MNQVIQVLWQSNIEFSLLLLAIFAARYGVRYASNNKNTYHLWTAIPASLVTVWMLKQIEFTKPPVEVVTKIVQVYVVQPYIIAPSQTINGWAYLANLSFLIAVVLLFRLLYQHLQLRNELCKIRTTEISTSSDSYEVVGVSQTDFSPAAYGFVKPKIYFPLHLEHQLSQEQIKLIIEHEEHHIKHGHLWLNLFWDIAVCLMWFNPLLYIARRCFRHDQELFCDHLVLQKKNRQARSAYGHALISTVSATRSGSLLCPWKSIHQLEERIMNIKNFNHFNNKILLTMFGAAIVAATSLYSVSAHEIIDDSDKQIGIHKLVLEGADETRQLRRVKIIMDNKTFVDENGERYVTDGDVKRDMTDEELRTFEREIEKAQQYEVDRKSKIGAEHGKGHKQTRIVSNHEGAELNDPELGVLEQEMRIEMEMHQDEFSMARHEIKMAEKDIAAAKLPKAEAERVRKQLANASKRLERDQQRMMKSMQKTRADIKRLRTDILHSKVN